MISLKRSLFFTFAILFATACAEPYATAQQTFLRFPRPSQKAMVMQTVGATEVTISYSRPGVKGRTIWGDAPTSMAARAGGEATLDNQNERKAGEPIVPYNHVWRAGANEATQFVVTNDVLINGLKLTAGSYSLHTIPGKEEWTIVFNRDANQWGSFTYDPGKDTLRIKAKPEWVADNQEWLMYSFDKVTENSAQVNIRWEKLRLPFTVEYALARERPTSPSFKATLVQTIGVTDVSITYNTGRVGVNEGLAFSATDDVLINGQRLSAGSYNLKTVPGNDEWTIIFNDAATQKESLSFKARPQSKAEEQNWLQVLSPTVTPSSAQVLIRWGRAALPLTVEVPSVEAVWRARANAAISANPNDERLPLQVAGFLSGAGKWDEALKWIDQSIRVKETFRNLSMKANILLAAGRKDEAYDIAGGALARGKAEKVDTTSFEKRFPGVTAVARITTQVESTPPAPRITPQVESTTPPTRILSREEGATPAPLTAAGRYYALVIGNDRYQFVPGLELAEADARSVASILHEKYGFSTKLLLNATRQDIMSALNNYRRTLETGDNLLVYYAGHGYYDREVDQAYWLPVDSRRDDNANWISADDITKGVRGVAARHVLIVSDSCYSGTISRDLTVTISDPVVRSRFLQKMMDGKSRTLMSSGGNEPVSDGGGSGHSVFARAFLTGLAQANKDVFTAEELFHDFVQERVAGGARQTPVYSPLRYSGHDSGDFVFVRVR